MALTGKAHKCCDKKTTPKATERLTRFKSTVVQPCLFVWEAGAAAPERGAGRQHRKGEGGEICG